MTTPQPTTVASIGVGIDTSRYGHHVSFLRDDLQPATEPRVITEAKQGYNKLLNTLVYCSLKIAAIRISSRSMIRDCRPRLGPLAVGGFFMRTRAQYRYG